jgi:hypothetical protein
MALPVFINKIVVNSQQNNASVSVGANIQNGWSSHGKQNSGLGMLIGICNLAINPLNYTNDSDLADSPMSVVDPMPTAQGQGV